MLLTFWKEDYSPDIRMTGKSLPLLWFPAIHCKPLEAACLLRVSGWLPPMFSHRPLDCMVKRRSRPWRKSQKKALPSRPTKLLVGRRDLWLHEGHPIVTFLITRESTLIRLYLMSGKTKTSSDFTINLKVMKTTDSLKSSLRSLSESFRQRLDYHVEVEQEGVGLMIRRGWQMSEQEMWGWDRSWAQGLPFTTCVTLDKLI